MQLLVSLVSMCTHINFQAAGASNHSSSAMLPPAEELVSVFYPRPIPDTAKGPALAANLFVNGTIKPPRSAHSRRSMGT